MKKRFYQLGKKVAILSAVAICALLTANQTFAQGVSINATGTGTAPDGSAILDLNIVTKGFLVPRMTQAQRNAIGSPANSLLIYQTDNTPGFYYNSGTPGAPVWTTFGGGSGPTAGNDINVTGTQVDVQPVLDFVHTINGAASNPLTLNAPLFNDLILQTSGTERARLTSAGNFGVGTNAPAELFSVGSGSPFKVNNAGAITAAAGVTSSGTITFSGLSTAGFVTNTAAGVLGTTVPGTNGYVLTSSTLGVPTWVNPTSLGTTYSAGAGLTLTGTQFSLTSPVLTSLGGLGADMTAGAIGAIPYATSTTTYGTLPAGTLGYALLSNGPGTAPSWGVPTPAAHNILSASHGDAVTTAVVRGDVMIGNSTPKWDRLALGSAGKFLQSVAADAAYSSYSMPVGALTANQLLFASSTTAVTGLTSGNTSALVTSSTGVPSWTSGTTANRLLRTDGTTVTFGQAVLTTDVTGILPIANGGTGVSNTATAYSVFGNNTNLAAAPSFTSGPITSSHGFAGSTSGIVTISPQATAGTFTLLLPNSIGSANQVLANSGTPGTLTWATSFINPMNQIGDIVYSTDALGTPDDLDPGTAGMVLHTNGAAAPTWAKVNLTAATEVTGTTGNNLLLGNASGAVTELTGGLANYTVRNNGTTWVTNANATSGLFTDGTNASIGVAPATEAKLVIAPTAQSALSLRGGNDNTGAGGLTQIIFDYGANPSVVQEHTITTKHQSSGGASNSIDFNVFSAVNPVLSVQGNGVAFKGALMPNGLPGTAGQVLASGGAGVTPTWVPAPTGTNTGDVTLAVIGSTPNVNGATLAAQVLNLEPASVGFGGVVTTGTQSMAGAKTWTGIASFTSGTASTTTGNGSVVITGGTGVSGTVNANNLMAANGATATPSIGFTANTNTGLWTSGSAGTTVVGVSANAVEGMRVTPIGVGVMGGVPTATNALVVVGKVKSTGINETSDARLKMNFASIDGALSKVLSMNGKYYDWRTTEFPNRGLEEGRQVGVIAQEIEKILPEVVVTDDDGFKSVEYGHIVPVLIEAIKEQQKIIDGQKSTINDLKASLENVLNRVNIIEKNVDLNSSKVEK